MRVRHAGQAHGDSIVDNFSEHAPRAINNGGRSTKGFDDDLGLQRLLADQGRDDVAKASWHVFGELEPNFVAITCGSTSDRDLQMPALIQAALAPAQGHAPTEEGQFIGVVIVGVHGERRASTCPIVTEMIEHRRDIEGVVDPHLALNLAVSRHQRASRRFCRARRVS